MAWMELRYERPETVAQACALLAEMPDQAVVLAGGTDIQIKLRSGELAPSLLVDIKHIPELSAIIWERDGSLSLGSAVTMRQLYENEMVAATYPALAQGAQAVGSLQIRCRGTLGGNLCNASPCMDTAPGLLVLEGRVKLVSAKAEREIPLAQFFAGVKRTHLQPGELCTAIVVPSSSQRLQTAFAKIKRVRGHDLALVNAAAALDPESKTLCAAIGSAAPTPVMTPAIKNVSAKDADLDDVAKRLTAAAFEMIRPIDDVRASAEYRRDMTAFLCRKLVHQLLA
jgi:CO/xanthine dehydrogenase FAD-binding subunit